MEVNSSPGLEGIEQTTNKDIADAILAFVEENARPNNNRTRGGQG
jgi:ribosomal protein S6--L-glutamate ligase